MERCPLHPPDSRLLVCRPTYRSGCFIFLWPLSGGMPPRRCPAGFATAAIFRDAPFWASPRGRGPPWKAAVIYFIGVSRPFCGRRSPVALGFCAFPPDCEHPTGTRSSTNCREPGRRNCLTKHRWNQQIGPREWRRTATLARVRKRLAMEAARVLVQTATRHTDPRSPDFLYFR